VFDKYSVIDMFGPVYGENWHKAEIHDGLTFRWMGPGRTSSLRIPTMGASEIRLRWILGVSPTDAQLSDVRCVVDEQDVTLRWAMRGAYSTLWADIKLQSGRPAVVATLTAPLRDPAQDGHATGLAVSRVEIFALDEALVGAHAQAATDELARLRRRTAIAEDELGQVYSSTSWKVSAPLRWAKRAIRG
jgi:hypothetical protein